MKLKIRYNPNSINVSDIVKQVKQHIIDKQQETKNDNKIKLAAKQKLINKLNSLNIPQDVKNDLLKSDLELIFDSYSLIKSERPVIGFIFKLTRTICKPFLKFIINIDPLLHFLHRQSYLINLYKEVIIDLLFEIEKLQQHKIKKMNNKTQQFRQFKNKHPKSKSKNES
jgi:hypothetical protein